MKSSHSLEKMRFKTTQKGATMWTTLTVVMMACFLFYQGFAVGSLFLDHGFIRASMKELVEQPNFKTMTIQTILATVNKRLTIDNIRGLDKDTISIKQDKSGEKYILIKYQAKTHIIANVSAVIDFEEEIRAGK